jgi:hypothetical protein
VGQHGVQQRIVGERGVVERQFAVRKLLFPHRPAHGEAGIGDHFRQRGTVGRRFEIVDDVRFDAGFANQCKRAARVAAGLVVIHRGMHEVLLVGSNYRHCMHNRLLACRAPPPLQSGSMGR